MNILAIIPARGGSKRIPKKNIKPFLGKPIIGYAIESSRDTGIFTEIMVSTDDQSIAKIAKLFGAKVPFMRTKPNASDHATTSEVLVEVLKDYQKIGKEFDYVCCIYPTSVLIKPAVILAGYDLLKQNKFDMVLPVLPFGYPIQRALEIEQEKIAMVTPKYQNTRSQDLPTRYHDSGQFYWFKTASFMKEKNLWMRKTGAIILKPNQAQDIDNQEDWEMALVKYRLNYQ